MLPGDRPVVLVVDQFTHLGGAQRVLLDLLPAGEDFSFVFALPGPGPFSRELERHNIRWVPISLGNYSDGRKSPVDVLRYITRLPLAVTQLAQLAGSIGAQLIYVNGPRAFLPAGIAARLARRPSLWHLHWQASSALDRAIVKMAARLVSPAVIACSQACLEPFAPRSALRRNATVVYNGVRQVATSVMHLAPGSAEPRIAVIARLHPDKGQDDLLGAAPHILARFPKARFILIGAAQDPGYMEGVRARARALGPGRVEFHDHIASPLYSTGPVDVLVVPSRRDPAPLVILEAFAAGIPVVASDAGGNPEMVAHENNGLLFPAADVEMLAARVIQVLADSDLRSRLILGALESYRLRWTIERFRQEVFEQIARQTGRPRLARAAPG